MGVNGLSNGKNGKKAAVIGGASVTTIISLIMYINTQVSSMKDEMINKLDELQTKEEVLLTRIDDSLDDIKEQLSVMDTHIENLYERRE